MQKLTVRVKNKISAPLPDLFALIVYGWKCGITNYIGVFGSFSIDEKRVCKGVVGNLFNG